MKGPFPFILLAAGFMLAAYFVSRKPRSVVTYRVNGGPVLPATLFKMTPQTSLTPGKSSETKASSGCGCLL